MKFTFNLNRFERSVWLYTSSCTRNPDIIETYLKLSTEHHPLDMSLAGVLRSDAGVLWIYSLRLTALILDMHSPEIT